MMTPAMAPEAMTTAAVTTMTPVAAVLSATAPEASVVAAALGASAVATAPVTETETDELWKRIREMEMRLDQADDAQRRLKDAEEKVRRLEEEIQKLRDRHEELEWAAKTSEGKLEEEKDARKSDIAELKGELTKKMDEMGKGERQGGEEGGNDGGGDRRGGEEEIRRPNPRTKCVILVDSNGREATPDLIKSHIPQEQRDNLDIKVEVAYTTEEACDRLERGQIDVRGAGVVIDNLTNDARGSRWKAAASPDELLQRVDRLRRRLLEAGAMAVVTCQIKPMQTVDVTPHNTLISDYLRADPDGIGYGCQTQVRMYSLARDGFHVKPEFRPVIYRGYACAIMGKRVICPTPREDFLPDSMKRRRDVEWPRVGRHVSRVRWGEGGGSSSVHGRRW